MAARPAALTKLTEKGVKIIGYTPGGYMPDELVYAAGAIPVGLIRGGDPDPVMISASYIARFIDTFCRAQIGYRMLGEEPLYQMVDLVVVPCTDRNMVGVADCWEMWTDVEVFKFGIPRAKTEHGFQYYLEGIQLLKDRLENITGNRITDQALKQEIDLYNKMRSLLKDISYLRKSDCPPISGKDFVRLNHASFLADRHFLVDFLESLAKELKTGVAKQQIGPRVFLTGSTIAAGDSKVIDLLEATGAQIVIEEFAEGMRHYWEKVKVEGNLMEALADRYFRRRVPPPAYNRPATQERVKFYLDLTKEFKVDGVIWYSLMYRDAYDIEGFFFEPIFKQAGLPMIKLMSDYDIHAEIGPMRTRIETFIEVVRGRRK
jgi:benzoyl-CoA reductase/2-hydroxyglutaryl-CoA dehydratase subunit BcrC/BadD/HgdB